MNLKIDSFDTTLDAFEDGGEKTEKRNQAKVEKEGQIAQKVLDLTKKLNKKNLEFKKSFTDASMDTVQIALDIEVTTKELEIAKTIQTKLFPATAK